MEISVYFISHKASRRFYVGQSSTTTTRLASHRNMLKRGDHHCIHLQRAWDMYGESEFDFICFESFETKAEAMKAEQALLDKYFSTGVLFNSASSNDPRIGIQWATTKEARKRTSLTRSKAPHLLEQLANARKNAFTPEAIAKRVANTKRNGTACAAQRMAVRAIDYANGNCFRFASMSEAARMTGVNRGNIHSCCNGTRRIASGLIFTYKWMVEPETEKHNNK